MPWYDSDNSLVDIVCILDRSGSMSSMQKEAIDGFNDFIEEQKKEDGEANVSLILFDNEYTPVYEAKPLKDVEPLTDKTFIPRGGTALLDAMGRAVGTTKERLWKMKEEDQPGKVIFCIITDGQENQSTEFKKDAIKELVETCRKDYSWEFAFLSADEDAISDAGSFGIARGMVAAYSASKSGTTRAR